MTEMDIPPEDLEKDYPGSPFDEAEDYGLPINQNSRPDLELERSILGAILADPDDALPLALEMNLTSDDFFNSAHCLIFETMLALYNDNKAVDLVTLTTRLEQEKILKKVGGVSYVSEIHDQYGIPTNVGEYASLIIDRAILRRLLKASTEISEICRSNPPDVSQVLDDAEAAIFKIRDEKTTNRLVHVSEPMRKAYQHILDVKNISGGITGVPTGFSKLDFLTGGFQKTDLIIVGGRPGMGKTSLALNFALNAAIPAQRESRKDFPEIPVAIFSMEMGNEQILQRLLCQLGHHDVVDIRTGRINEGDIQRLTVNAGVLSKSKIYVDDSSALRPLELRAKARRLKSSLKNINLDLGLIVVDYLQLMRANGRHNNREQEIREISGSLKSLAKELEVPVITLSQLRRSDELEPSLADLRDSGSIEQDADLVFFIVRPEVKKKDDPTLKGKAELRINKHRNGPLDTVHLIYKAQSTTFLPGTNVESIEDI
ncbi:MAG: replicative DNA helicase [Deltaproteobacteria bacterium]|jgi:replicative DNA helicase|nr:replicative DNA helicase [Deltaproteobacteria bacterium]